MGECKRQGQHVAFYRTFLKTTLRDGSFLIKDYYDENGQQLEDETKP